jgi:hypothetical protein
VAPLVVQLGIGISVTCSSPASGVGVAANPLCETPSPTTNDTNKTLNAGFTLDRLEKFIGPPIVFEEKFRLEISHASSKQPKINYTRRDEQPAIMAYT